VGRRSALGRNARRTGHPPNLTGRLTPRALPHRLPPDNPQTWEAGKAVRIGHGPATVIGSKRRKSGHPPAPLGLLLFARESAATKPQFSWGFFVACKRMASKPEASTARQFPSPIPEKRDRAAKAAAALLASLILGPLALGQPCPAWSAAGTALGVPARRPVSDEAGRRVELPENIRRIVTLAPNLTEIVYALGEGARIAGDTDFCDYPPQATQKPHIGGPVNPSLERIVSLSPDVILASETINRRETVDALARLRMSVYVTDPHSVDDMLLSVEHIGDILRARKAAERLVDGMRMRLSALHRQLAGTRPRRVLFVVWTDPLISVGRDTFLADALRRAGASSVVDSGTEWPRVSLEEMVKLQPEYLVFASAHGRETKQDIFALRSLAGWRDLDALRRGNVVVVSDAINRPAPRLVDAIEQLARALHPKAFATPTMGRNAAPSAFEEACACAR
jgi:cobalamin transport system substrate-binding protein